MKITTRNWHGASFSFHNSLPLHFIALISTIMKPSTEPLPLKTFFFSKHMHEFQRSQWHTLMLCTETAPQINNIINYIVRTAAPTSLRQPFYHCSENKFDRNCTASRFTWHPLSQESIVWFAPHRYQISPGLTQLELARTRTIQT